MKTKETFTTSIELVAAYLLAKGIKMERIEIVSKKYFTDCCFHFPKEEAEKLLKGERMVNFTDLKINHDCLCIEAVKAVNEFKQTQGGRS
jgi:hypothetical protein